MIGPMARDHLLATGHQARQAQRILVRFSTAQGEEEGLQVTRGQLGQQLPKASADLGGELWRGEGECAGLLGDRLGHATVAVPDVHAHQLAVEVDVALAVGVPEIDPLCPIDDDRVDLRLGGPGEEGVLAIEAQDLVGRQPMGRRGGHAHLRGWGAIRPHAGRGRKRPLRCPYSEVQAPDGTAPVRLFEMSDQRAEEGTLAFRDIGISVLNPAADTAPCLAPFAVLLGCRHLIESGDQIALGVCLRNALKSPAPRQLAGLRRPHGAVLRGRHRPDPDRGGQRADGVDLDRRDRPGGPVAVREREEVL